MPSSFDDHWLSSSFRELSDLIRDENLLGVQLAVEDLDSGLCTMSLGNATAGVRLLDEHQFGVRCAIRPLIALCIGKLSDRTIIDRQTPVCDQIDSSSWLTACKASPADLLSQRTSICHPSALNAHFMSPGQRTLAIQRALEGRRDGDGGYSDYANWRILVDFLTEMTRQSGPTVVLDEVVHPLGLAGDVEIGLQPEKNQHLKVAACRLPDGRHVGSPMELTTRVVSDQLCLGGYSNARGLCRMYSSVLRQLNGDHVEQGVPLARTIEQMLANRRGEIHDTTLQRDCDFAEGFMIDMARHGVPGFSSESFGFVGFRGASVGLADPVAGVSLGLVLLGAPANPVSVATIRERALNVVALCGVSKP